MASIAAESSSSASRHSAETIRPEAGPLPSKRGEIGYVEEEHGAEAQENAAADPALPARHPADRQMSPATTIASLTPTTASTLPNSPSSATLNSANPDKNKKSCLTQKCIPGGFMLTTVLALLVQLICLGGTIVGWVFIVRLLQKPKSTSSEDDKFGSSIVFIHVTFVIASLGQLLFLERRIYRLRAERYNHLHPGEILPTSSRRRWLNANPTAIAFSPWNRAPLPTYAAALRETGVGTGDVEDNMIAVQPPPAYGNTRGSRLLLTGFLRESLRAQRPASAHSQMSQRDPATRPVSYQSKDEEWEVIQDADRARMLEETLSNLERPTTRN